jgi:hypothetical protein
LARVQSVQRSRATPEALALVQAKSEQRDRAKKNAGKAKRLHTVQAYSKSTFGGTMACMRSASFAPPPPSGSFSFGVAAPAPPASAPMMLILFGGGANNQAEVTERAQLSSAAMASLQTAAECSDDEEAEQAIESARVQLELAGHTWASRGEAGAAEAADLLGCGGGEGDDGVSGDGGSSGGVLADLLRDLQVEPADDADAARRFALYEAHAETVATVRKSLVSFWAGAASDVPAGLPKQAIEASLASIDRPENLELYVEPRHWFVYSMAVKAAANEHQLGAVLRTITAKLEVLANVDDCPICLEPIDLEMSHSGGGGGCFALGCAHKLHADCWRHWSAHCAQQSKAAFCPLCRNDEFLEEVLSPNA